MKVDVQTSAAICHKFRVLLVRRSLSDPAYPGRWDLPGGSIGKDEHTLENAVKRLVEDQTGLVIIPEVMFDNRRRNEVWQVVFAARLADELMSKPVLRPDLLAYKWVSRSEAAKLPLTPRTDVRLKEVYDYMYYRPVAPEVEEQAKTKLPTSRRKVANVRTKRAA